MGYTIMEPKVPIGLSLAGTIIYTIILISGIFTSLENVPYGKWIFGIGTAISVLLVYIPVINNKWCEDSCGQSYCINGCKANCGDDQNCKNQCESECPENVNYCLEGCGKDLRITMVTFSTIIIILVTLIVLISEAEDNNSTKAVLVLISIMALLPMYLVSTNTLGFMCRCDPVREGSGNVCKECEEKQCNSVTCNELSECSCIV